MRAALVQQLGGIDRVELGERPDPAPAAGIAGQAARRKIVLQIGQ